MLRRALSHGELVEGLCGIDSEHLVQEAFRSGLQLETVFLSESCSQHALEDFDALERVILPDNIFKGLVSTEAPQGIAALVRAPQWDADTVLGEQRALVVTSAGIQDPGNLGTIVRSAEAFGATAVISFSGTVSLWNPKTLRASAGSVFRLPVLEVRGSSGEAVEQLRRFGFAIYAADSHRGEIAPATDLRHKVAIVIGNEGQGVPHAIVEAADGFVRIPHMQTVESLNAGMAASLLLYEAFRQRHYKDAP
jgi:RNA methyltransferase, TrmH family